MFRVTFVGIYVAFTFAFAPLMVHAQPQVTPWKNPICWQEKSCKEKGGQWGGASNECPKPFGLCYVKTQPTSLSIKIGETAAVQNIGEYIKIFYRWAVGIAVIMAAAFLVIAGVMWLTAGGSAERVTRAKTMLASAIVGLFLVAGSYLLLNTINPELVRLRIPPIAMIRQFQLGTPWCRDLSKGSKVTQSSSGIKYADINEADWFEPQLGNVPDPRLKCDAEYYIQASPEETCWGNWCPETSDGKTQSCKQETQKKFKCVPGSLSGTITSPDVEFPFVFQDVAGLSGGLRLMGVCKNGHQFEVATAELTDAEDEQSQAYVFDLEGKTQTIWYGCLPQGPGGYTEAQGKGELLGFYIAAYVHDPVIWSGGCPDWFAIGRSSPQSCDKNLNVLIASKTGASTPDSKTNPIAWSCANTSYGSPKPNAALADPAHLITDAELLTGHTCDIALKRSEFPSLNNANPYPPFTCLSKEPTWCLYYQYSPATPSGKSQDLKEYTPEAHGKNF